MLSHSLKAKIEQKMALLSEKQLLRKRRILPEGLIDFSNNDYLGFARSPLLINAMIEGSRRFGAGSGASPLVSGYSLAHKMAEDVLCKQTGHQAAMLFNSGFSANQALFTTLFDNKDTLIADKLVHASIIDGLRDSGANYKRYFHNDIEHAAGLLAKHKPSALVTETVFSMDGDTAPLKALKSLCQQHNTWMIVDDAHGFGCHYTNAKVNASIADIQLVTFGKALGCQGAALLGTREFIDFMVANCRHYIYSTALSPAAAFTAYKAMTEIDTNVERQHQLVSNIQFFREYCLKRNIAITDSQTAIQPIIIGDARQTLDVANVLEKEGFLVGAIRPPTVPTARLRITLSSYHSQQQIIQLVDHLKNALACVQNR